jgi:hypothetical protein
MIDSSITMYKLGSNSVDGHNSVIPHLLVHGVQQNYCLIQVVLTVVQNIFHTLADPVPFSLFCVQPFQVKFVLRICHALTQVMPERIKGNLYI